MLYKGFPSSLSVSLTSLFKDLHECLRDASDRVPSASSEAVHVMASQSVQEAASERAPERVERLRAALHDLREDDGSQDVGKVLKA